MLYDFSECEKMVLDEWITLKSGFCLKEGNLYIEVREEGINVVRTDLKRIVYQIENDTVYKMMFKLAWCILNA